MAYLEYLTKELYNLADSLKGWVIEHAIHRQDQEYDVIVIRRLEYVVQWRTVIMGVRRKTPGREICVDADFMWMLRPEDLL